MPTLFALAASPRLRPTPFHDRVLAAGARAFSIYNHMPLRAGGRSAGYVTSAAYSPRLERNVALAMVATQREGAELRVTLEDGSQRDASVAREDWSDSRQTCA